MKPNAAWRVVYVARNSLQADEIAQLLTNEGFLVRQHPLEGVGSSAGTIELCVLSSEAEYAQRFILESAL